jgi:hypothetical protein
MALKKDGHSLKSYLGRYIQTQPRTLVSPEDGDNVSLKHWYLPASPHGSTTQKTNINIFTAMRTSNLCKNVVYLFRNKPT